MDYRTDADPFKPLQNEVNALKGENETLRVQVARDREKAVNRMFWWLLLFALVGVVAVIVRWRLQGWATGNTARANAEVAARQYFAATVPSPVMSVYCRSGDDLRCVGDRGLCEGRVAVETVLACCDDRTPPHNAGCVPAGIPDPCSAQLTCGACVVLPRCGWCSSLALCSSGTVDGPAHGSCQRGQWAWAAGRCGP